MKSTNPFIWLAGVDRETLDTCSNFEKIKQQGIGMLILIPTLLGFISMSFAISTLTTKWYVYLSIGTIWALIVLIIDRFLISTFKKNESILPDIFSLKFLFRLVLSIGIGLTTSHPLILFIFDSTIKQELESSKQIQIQKIRDSHKLKIRQSDSLLTQYYKENILPKEELINCLQSVASNEQSGIAVSTICGGVQYNSSGIPEPRERFSFYKHAIDSLRIDKINLEKIHKNKIKEADSLLAIDGKLMTDNINGFSINYSQDYLNRILAFGKIKIKTESGDEVRTTVLFLIIFFIFIDILPVLLKAFTPIGEYDKKIQRLEEVNIYLSNIDFDNLKDIERIKKEIRYFFLKSKLSRIPYKEFKNLNDLDAYLDSL